MDGACPHWIGRRKRKKRGRDVIKESRMGSFSSHTHTHISQQTHTHRLSTKRNWGRKGEEWEEEEKEGELGLGKEKKNSTHSWLASLCFSTNFLKWVTLSLNYINLKSNWFSVYVECWWLWVVSMVYLVALSIFTWTESTMWVVRVWMKIEELMNMVVLGWEFDTK